MDGVLWPGFNIFIRNLNFKLNNFIEFSCLTSIDTTLHSLYVNYLHTLWLVFYVVYI